MGATSGGTLNRDAPDVRALTSDDAQGYWQLRLRALREHPEAFASSYEEGLAHPLAQVVAMLADPDRVTFGAFVGAGMVGTAAVQRESRLKTRHRADLVGVYVAPEARGRGIGRAVVLAALERAHAWDGVVQVELVAAAPNEPATRLYRSLGFKVYGRQPRALKLPDGYVDFELMVLRLD